MANLADWEWLNDYSLCTPKEDLCAGIVLTPSPLSNPLCARLQVRGDLPSLVNRTTSRRPISRAHKVITDNALPATTRLDLTKPGIEISIART